MKTKTGLSLAALCLVVSVGCERIDGNSKDLPNKPEDLTADNTKWDPLADELKIGHNLAQSELSVPSTDATSASFVDTMTKLHLAQGAYKTRCASVDSFTVTTPVNAKGVASATGFDNKLAALDAHVYVMKYRLQKNAAGDAEDTARTGLVVVPKSPATTSGKAVLVAYAHDGSAGLSYNELAAAFSTMQLQHVIIAPTYAGEPLCAVAADEANPTKCVAEKRLADAVGTNDVFNGDADDVLGMHDCIVRAYVDAVTAGAGASVTAKYATGTQVGTLAIKDAATNTDTTLMAYMHSKLDAIGGTVSPVANYLPKSILVGSGRGGLVSQIAAGRAGAALATIAASTDAAKLLATLGSKYFSVINPADTTNTTLTFSSLFSAQAIVSPAFGFTAGINRLMLEAMARGMTKLNNGATDFSPIPGVRGFYSTVMKPYVDGTADVATTANAIRIRDASFNAILGQVAIRNWGKYSKTDKTITNANAAAGSTLFIHGFEDSVYNYTNTQLLHNINLGIYAQNYTVTDLTKRSFPGNKPKTRILKATDAFKNPNGSLINVPDTTTAYTEHGDAAFFAATSAIIPNFVPTESIRALDDFDKSAANTPQTAATIIGTWRATEAQASLTP